MKLTFFYVTARNDGITLCTNSLDDVGCQCTENEFTCHCYTQRICAEQESCFEKIFAKVDRFGFCLDRRIPFHTKGKISIQKKFEFNNLSFSGCGNSTCFEIKVSACIESQRLNLNQDSACTNYCSEVQSCEHDSIVQCANKNDIVLHQLCDGYEDCSDGSDEIKNQPGFKHNDCIVPQINFQCNDVSDLCLCDVYEFCFQCLDKRLNISRSQVCDGVIDCFDSSDECLCDKNINRIICEDFIPQKNNLCFEALYSVFQQHSSFFNIINTFDNLSESCPVEVIDNNRIDTCGGEHFFEEKNCVYRLQTFASEMFVNATNKSFEKNEETQNLNHFSSRTEMIANPVLRSAFWIIGFIVMAGNVFVVYNTAVFITTKSIPSVFRFQHVIILNISIADFIMGVYLLTIAGYSANFSGSYGLVDLKWRSSLKCSIVGSLSVISSEASCFLMVILTAFRLRNISQPMKSLNYSLLPWKISIAGSWLLSIFLGAVPIKNTTVTYFAHSISFCSKFHRQRTIKVTELERFMCDYAALSNTTIRIYENNVKTIRMFLENNLPESLPLNVFGYYGETSVCLPRFYISHGDPSWVYTFMLTNVNFLCFFFIAISYILIFKRSFKFAKDLNKNASNKEVLLMQKRIARIVATDFCCWVPICIMAYVSLGYKLSSIVYQISAVFLLPINSALNPFMFSSLPDVLVKFFRLKVLGSYSRV